MRKQFLLASAISVMGVSLTQAADWPQFRGPFASGVSTETALPSSWSATEKIEWKTKLTGVAWSCPIVVGDKVLLATAYADGQPKPASRGAGGGGGRPGGGGAPGGGRGGNTLSYQWSVLAYDLNTGKELWTAKAGEGKPRYGTHGSNTFASETLASDGKSVFAYFGATGKVFAFDLEGKELWQADVGVYPSQNNWGTSSSPIVHDGKLFVQCDNEEKSFLVAFNTTDGKQAWRVERKEKTNWCTPTIWETKDRTELVVGGTGKLRSYNPADGKLYWELSTGGGQANASPVADGERLYFGASMGGGGRGRGGAGGAAPTAGVSGTLYAVKAGATGDITPKAGESTSEGVVWSVPRSVPAAATPLVYDGNIYLFERQGGMASCYDAATGKANYAKERITGAGAIWASPWAYDGKVFAIDETGKTFVLKAGKSFELLDTNTLDKDMYWSSPAVASGRVIVRGLDQLISIK